MFPYQVNGREMETHPISETLRSLVFKMADVEPSPKTQPF
jgi:hypothetical protein